MSSMRNLHAAPDESAMAPEPQASGRSATSAAELAVRGPGCGPGGRFSVRLWRRYLVGLAVVLPFVVTSCRRAAPVHIVVICIDTLRADHVGLWGYTRPTTPVIDELGKRGVIYENTLAPSDWTVPSVASLFTSLPPELHGAGETGDLRETRPGEPPRQAAKGLATLAESARAQGYRTGLFSSNPFLYGRFKDGFEVATVDRVDAARLTDAAIDWLGREDTRPLLLYIQYIDAHQPNRPPSPYYQMFPAADGLPHEDRHGDWSYGQVRDLEDPAFKSFRDHRIAVYDGSIRYIDAELGRLLAALDRPPFRGRTVVVVTSDHGEEFWDHAAEQAVWHDDPRGIWGVGHGHTMYQELLQVPLLIVGPGFPAGTRDLCPTSLLDIAPTILHSVGLNPMPGAAGINLQARLQRANAARCGERALYASSPAYGRNRSAVVVAGWKLIETVGGPPLLFDLSHDPGERTDLSLVAPRRLAVMRQHLARASASGTGAVGVRPETDGKLEEDLKALGYL